jgi:hypothetical protein
MTIPSSMICRCLRCGHRWVKRIDGQPKFCAHCNSPYWNTPKGAYKLARKKRKA